MKLETTFGDVQLLLETIKNHAEGLLKFTGETMTSGSLDKQVMEKRIIEAEIISTAFSALELHFKMKEQENGAKTN